MYEERVCVCVGGGGAAVGTFRDLIPYCGGR